MKKSLIFCSLFAAACFVSGAEYVFNTQASCELQGGRKSGFKNGAHVLKGSCHFWTTKMFKHDPKKKYTISAEVMTDCKNKISFVFGMVYFDDKGRWISTGRYITASNSFTELVKPISPTDKTIVIKRPAKFKKHPQWPYVVAFEAKEDNSDLPNMKVSTKVKKMTFAADTITITLDKPTFASYPAGTKVRLHYALSFYQPVNLHKYYDRPTDKWTKVGGVMKIPSGVKNFKPAVIFYGGNKEPKRYIYLRNFKLIEE